MIYWLFQNLLYKFRHIQSKICALFIYFYPNLYLQRGFKIIGIPYIKIGRESKILIGPNFTGISSWLANPVGHGNRLTLVALNRGLIKIANNVGITRANIVSTSYVYIGQNTIVGSGVCIWDTNFHPSNPLVRRINQSQLTGSSIIIGKNVFIGSGATILKGVKIGNNSTIAAHACVTKNVPPFHLAYGNPAIIRPYHSNA